MFFLLLFLSSCSQSSSSSSSTDTSSTCDTAFTYAPLESFSYIVPLGNSNPSGGHIFPTVHTYLYFEPWSEDPDPATTNVYAPGDITITLLESMTYLNEGTVDYTINFDTCDEAITGYFKHVKNLSDDLWDVVGTIDQDCNSYSTGGWDMQRCNETVDITIEAGTVIGTVGGSSATQTNFDFGVMDEDIHLEFINEDFYPSSQYSMACPFDYYDHDTQSTLENYLGLYQDDTFTPRTIEPICGEVMQDVEGTAKGNWLNPAYKSSFTSEDPHIGLFDYNYDPTYEVFSLGPDSGVTTNAYFTYFVPTSNGQSNRSFEDITPDGLVYCFNSIASDPGITDTHFRILLTLPDTNTLYLYMDYTTASCESIPANLNSYSYLEFNRQ